MRRFGVLLMVSGLVSMVTVGGVFGQGDETKKDSTAGGGGSRKEMRGRGGIGGASMLEGALWRIMSDSKAAAELGLTEEQTKTLKDAADASKKQTEELMKQMADLQKEQQELLDGDADEAAVMAVMDKLAPLRAEMEKARVKRVFLMKKVLTPEQLAKIKDKAQQRMKPRDENSDKGGKTERSRPGAEPVKPGESAGK